MVVRFVLPARVRPRVTTVARLALLRGSCQQPRHHPRREWLSSAAAQGMRRLACAAHLAPEPLLKKGQCRGWSRFHLLPRQSRRDLRRPREKHPRNLWITRTRTRETAGQRTCACRRARDTARTSGGGRALSRGRCFTDPAKWLADGVCICSRRKRALRPPQPVSATAGVASLLSRARPGWRGRTRQRGHGCPPGRW